MTVPLGAHSQPPTKSLNLVKAKVWSVRLAAVKSDTPRNGSRQSREGHFGARKTARVPYTLRLGSGAWAFGKSRR